MAKKPTEKDPIIFTSDVLRMVNEQTMGSNASAEVAEALTTPGVSDGSDGAMFILEAKISMNSVLQTGAFVLGSSGQWTSQIQTGNRATTPVLVPPSSPFYFAHLTFTSRITTSGMNGGIYPVALDIARPEPVIVMGEFTIVHQGANHADHNDELVFMEILYRTCMLDDSVYNRALRNQSRLS